MNGLRVGSWAVAVLVAGSLSFPKPLLREGLSFSQAVYDREGRLLRLSLSSDDRYRLWLPLSGFSSALIEITLFQEDRYFRWHPGVNPASLVRAAWETYGARRRRIGGSTVTMQVARLRYGIDSRRISGKLIQILRALQLEWRYSKDEILEAYLNLAPFGRNIEGAGAASLIYFGKNAGRLTLPEAATLAVIPQSPLERTPHAGSEKALLGARASLLKRWVAEHARDRRYAILLGAAIPMRPPPGLPFEAPHFVDWVLHEDVRWTDRIRATLDLNLQSLVERQVKGYLEVKRRVGIRNAAVLLMDHRTMDVLAMVGSANFFDLGIQGQVNGCQAKRSPGSALKPFVYALSMDQGLVHPLTVLKDAPSRFGAFNPENFDGEFEGPVTAQDALIRSRNVPAVQLADRLRDPGLYDFLRQAQIDLPYGREYYGLAPVLGGAEVTMQDLVRLYAMLANGGVLKPLRARLDRELESADRALLSVEATALVLDILKEVSRPSQGYKPEWTGSALPVYWKTGTSYGFRDAWSVGIFGQYVLAVWIGNFSGEGNPAFVGIQAAAPLFFQIVDALLPRAEDQWLGSGLKAGNIAKVRVCATSGQFPSSHCPRIVETKFIPGKSPIDRCSIHRLVLVDPSTGLRPCPDRIAKSHSAVYEFWPSDLLRIFQFAGIPRRLPPLENPECDTGMASSGLAPQIHSPVSGLTYSVRVDALGRQTIPLSAVSDAGVRELYWFVNEEFVEMARNGETLFWKARPGRAVVRVVDDQGRSDARVIEVGLVQ